MKQNNKIKIVSPTLNGYTEVFLIDEEGQMHKIPFVRDVKIHIDVDNFVTAIIDLVNAEVDVAIEESESVKR
jgi:hypothetical protein